MILADTSVWIRFLYNKAPYSAELQRLLRLETIAGHKLVFCELLIGDPGGRKALLNSYSRIHQLPVVPHADVVQFVRDHKLHGRSLGWTGVHLLASTILGRARLWTVDGNLASLADEFNVAYRR